MKKIHILENALRCLLDEGRNAEKAKQKTIAVIKSYLSQNGIQGRQLESMTMEYENSFKEWLFHANMSDSIIRLEPIMANVAMQLGFTPQNKDTRELYRLQDIANYIIANYNKEDFPIALNKLTLNNTTFERLNELFGNAIDASKGTWKPSNDGKPKPHYIVKRLDTFEEAHKYYPYTQKICYLGGKGTWDDYTSKGRNAVYVLLRDGWENIPAKHEKDTPYDDYGKSMVFVIIRPDGEVAYTNTRWNHNTDDQGPRNVDQSFTENMNDVSDMLQTDYRNVLKPYSEDELLEKGFITFSMLRQWISEGRDILELCKNSKEVCQISDNLFEISLPQEYSVLYNSYFNRLMPSDNIILQYIEKLNEGYSAIQRQEGKWTLINADGEQICDWYKDVVNFQNGFGQVQRDDGKWTLINTQGQQICDWYKYIDAFDKGFASVKRDDNKWSLINRDGQQICDWYKHVMYFENGYARVQREDGKWSLINTNGQQICDWYKLVSNFRNGFAPVMREDGKWSFINTDGKQIGDWYDNVYGFDENGFAVVERNNMESFINTKGQRICDWYRYIDEFNDGIARVERDDRKKSFINREGQQICGWYNQAYGFHNGFAQVQENDDEWYYMDTKGNLYDKNKHPISVQNEVYKRLNNLIAEVLHMSFKNYLLYN